MAAIPPREGMMAVVRNRRAMITGVKPFDADEQGRFHVVEVEYTDGLGAETDQLLWEVEPGTEVLEPSSLPRVADTPPMQPAEFDAMVRAARWAALTPSLPFSGLQEDCPPLAAPLFGAIYPEAYQLVPVLQALEMPRVALMLADAVGLGKTIEAGMVMRELMLRRRIRRVLVLCPASLRTQWRDEMAEKFDLPFDVVDQAATLRLQREQGLDANPWRVHERIIASYYYLKQPDVLEQFRSAGEPGEDGRLRWDLLIVDEAHNLAPASFGRDSDLSKMLQRIAPWFEHRLFLTATPHNGHTRSFSGLLEALDPVRFTRKSELDAEDRTRVSEVVVRRLKREINHCYEQMGEPARFSERSVDALPPLQYSDAERSLHEAFQAFRKALRSVTKGATSGEHTAGTFATDVLQQRILSGPWAFGQSWTAVVEGLTATKTSAESVVRAASVQADDTEDDAERESRQRHAGRTVGAWLRTWEARLQSEIQAVTKAVARAGVQRIPPGLSPDDHRSAVAAAAVKVSADARLDTLCALIDQRVRQDGSWRGDERIVVFTEYLATLDYLTARLEARYGAGSWLLRLFGGMNDTHRDAIKKAFNDPRGPARILLATDTAGEGLNLQRACRLLLHWDLPWNPGKMEQRNGRLDRHGQERDVQVFHFDSTDDASLRFLGHVLKKRSQTREDRVVTDELFADAILAHFDLDQDAAAVSARLDRAIVNSQVQMAEAKDDIPEGTAIPGKPDQDRLEALKQELDLSPETLRETLETAMAVEAGRPRLKSDGPGRDRLVHPVPALWQDLVDHTLRQDGPNSGLLALVFDPAHYVQTRGGRPVFLPESDSRLLHLGNALYHRVMSTFARYRFPGGPVGASRWTVRTGKVPEGADALVLLTIEEMAVNELRETCHHWVRTVALKVKGTTLAGQLPHLAPPQWGSPPGLGDRNKARERWDDVDGATKKFVLDLQTALTQDLKSRLQEAGKVVAEQERVRFDRRRRELKKAINENQIERLRKEADKLRLRAQQQEMFTEHDQELARRIADLEAERALRQNHYESVIARLNEEEQRTLKGILPLRYAMHGDARVYPIAVEIRLPGGEG